MPRVPILDGSGKVVKAQLPALAKADVGLSSVDNTADAAKPVSAAQAAAIAAKASLSGATFTGPVSAPDATAAGHLVTKAQLDSAVAAAGGMSGTLVAPGVFRLGTTSTGGSGAGSVTWLSGVYPRKQEQVAIDFGTARGKPVDVVTTFMDRSSWATINNAWHVGYVPAGANAAVAVPMWPDDGNATAASDGTYDANWTTFATQIRDAGFPNAIIRLGWEPNVEETVSKATPANVAAWIAAFRRARDRIKAVAPGMVINWNVNIGVSGSSCLADISQAWPGDAYVDEVGIDAYDWYPAYTAANWPGRRDATYGGWTYWLNFAKTRGKKLSIPEWGLAKTSAQGGGDNPFYIEMVYSWIEANRADFSWEAYFAENDSEYVTPIMDFTPTNTPNAWAEYVSWFA